jgi:transcriptional regulator with XRE-family HTH domain
MNTTAPSIGEHLRSWRQRRRRSQLDLALDAEVSARHLSFVETGRARPSRELILNLAGRLNVPLREQNELLLAAGYAPAFTAHPLESSALADARAAIDHILAAHAPWPAVAVDRHWTLVAANDCIGPLVAGAAPALLKPPVNVLRLALHPDGIAPRIVNFDEWAVHLLLRLQGDLFATADPVLAALLAELRTYVPGPAHHDYPPPRIFLPLMLRADDGSVLSFISTVTNFGTPSDVTLAELSLETFFPADAATRAAIGG